MKTKTTLSNVCFYSLLLITLFINHGFAQGTSQAKLELPKLNFNLQPKIACVNFSQENTTQANHLAKRFYQIIKAKFDSVGKSKQSHVYTIDPSKKAHFTCQIVISQGCYKFCKQLSQDKDKVYLYTQIVNNATQDTVSYSSFNLRTLDQVTNKRMHRLTRLLSRILFYEFKDMSIVTNQVVNPDNRPSPENKGNLVIPNYFSANRPELQPLAKKITHLVNNSLVKSKITAQKTWHVRQSFTYRFNYYPTYRLPDQTYKPGFNDHLLQGELSQKDEQHLVLYLNFTGRNLKFKSDESNTTQKIVFKKAPIENNDYSELIYKIRKYFKSFVLSNYE